MPRTKLYTSHRGGAAGETGSRRSHRLEMLLVRFGRDESGQVMITFGLMSIMMFLMIGGAVDIGRWLQARTITTNALDAAVLAGGRMLQLNQTNSASAVESANRFYADNIKDRLPVQSDSIAFAPTDGGLAFTATGNAYIRTPFLSLAGVDQLPLLSEAGVDYSKSVLAVGGNAEYSLEISMMLDVTGSMSGNKIADLKLAAKDLIDIVVWDNQGEYYSKVALVPFSAQVNVGAYAEAVRGAFAPGTSTTPGSEYYTFVRRNDAPNTRTYRISECVTERTGAHAHTDEAPSVSPVGRSYTNNGSCTPGNEIMPLSNNKPVLKAAIDSFGANGMTAGHLGTAWAWYMLSPKWGYLWPATSQPAVYGAPKVKKIAILMTDGEYNTEYCNGVDDGTINCSSPNGSSTTQARATCTEMKKAQYGMEIYTIGFALGGNQSAITTLQHCASDPGKFYNAADGEQLRQAFRDIALKISSLYLAK